MQSGFASSGNFVSSLKDANPAPTTTANWSTLSWNATTPAGTSIQFQIAASNNAVGPFNFVGPDGTASTFFSNGGSLTQFTGDRYLKYQASFSTNSGTITPTLQDVTVCFSDTPGTTLVVATASGLFGGIADLSATLSSGGTGLSGKSVAFTLNGNNAGSGITDGSGIATVSAVSLTGINAGSYPGAVGASFAGDSGFSSSSGSGDLNVSKTNQTITFAPLAGKNLGDPDFTVSATASSSLAVTFAASGNCSVTGSTVHITGAGSCTITASQAGDTNYNLATDVPQSFSIAKSSQTITFAALGGKNFGDPDFTVSATASSSLAVTFAASGNCSVTGSLVHITGAGSCTITASQAGDTNYNLATDVPQSFSIAKSSQTITFAALGGKNFGDPDFAVNATTPSSLVVTFTAIGNCSVTGSTVHITGAGSCTVTASQAGDANYNSAIDVPQSFTIAKASQAITFAALVTRNFGDPDFTVSATASSSLAVSFIASGNCSVTGSTVHISNAGSCAITASQAGSSNFNPAADVPQSFVINKAVPLVTLSCPLAGFDTAPHACTAAATGIGNATISGSTTFTYSSNPTAPTNAGTYSVSASFTSGDGNYADAAGSGSLVIAKAVPIVTVSCPAGVIFDGNPHACTAAANGIGNAAVSGSLTLTYNAGAAPSGGGTYAVSASFTSGDGNYADASGSGSLTIGKASQIITFGVLAGKTFGDPDFAVSGTASSSLAVSFAAGGTCSVTGSAVHITGAGLCTITASQAGDANFNSAASVPRSFLINPGDDFAIIPTLPSVAVTAGQSATEHISDTPNPATLTPLSFTCSGLPAKASCSFSPNPVLPGSVPTDVVMTITTTASTTAALERPRTLYAAWLGFTSLGFVGLVLMGGRRKIRGKAGILGFLAVTVVLLAIGCGGRSVQPPTTVSGTPQGTSTITVTGATTGFTHSTTFTLTVN